MAGKHYVVWVGRVPGIYDSWEECNRQVRGFPSARYRAFATPEEARAALGEDWREHYGKKRPRSRGPVTDSISVDASCLGNPGPMEYRGVDTRTRKVLFSSKVYPRGTTNIGEFLAIVDGMRYLSESGKRLPIYSDSRVAIGWVGRKVCNTGLGWDEETAELLDQVGHALLWLVDNGGEARLLKWDTRQWGEIPADYGRK